MGRVAYLVVEYIALNMRRPVNEGMREEGVGHVQLSRCDIIQPHSPVPIQPPTAPLTNTKKRRDRMCY